MLLNIFLLINMYAFWHRGEHLGGILLYFMIMI